MTVKHASDEFEPIVAVKAYRLLLATMPTLLKLPKPFRYTLGQAIQTHILNLLELTYEANALPGPFREAPIVRAVAKTKLVTLLVRACAESGHLDETAYFRLATELAEIGKMFGGWLRHIRTTPAERKK